MAQQSRGTARAQRCIRVLTSAVECPGSASSGYHTEFHEGYKKNAYQSGTELQLVSTKLNNADSTV